MVSSYVFCTFDCVAGSPKIEVGAADSSVFYAKTTAIRSSMWTVGVARIFDWGSCKFSPSTSFTLDIFVASCNILNFFAMYDVVEIVQFYQPNAQSMR